MREGTWKGSEDIEGLDDPMISPWMIPEGFQQEWDLYTKRWRLIPRQHWRRKQV
jgi:hypothetical protein